jgi:hypothetical protein
MTREVHNAPPKRAEPAAPAPQLAYASGASQGEVYRLGAASLALALVGQPTGMFCSISLSNRGLAWGNTAGFLVFAAVMVAAACLGLRARGLVRHSDFKLRGGWLGSAGLYLSLLLLAFFGAGFLLTWGA